MKIDIFLAVWTILMVSLSACSDLPDSGPSASSVLSVGSSDLALKPYEVIDVDPSTIEVLARRPRSSFADRFGDRRASSEPLIGVGDMLTVTIWEAASGGLFSTPAALKEISTGANSTTVPVQVVGSDGSISVPYAGRIRVAGQTPRAAQEVIQHALAGKAIQPQVLVLDPQPISTAVTVGGEGIAHARRLPLNINGDHLLDVIAEAGGVKFPINEIVVVLQRNGVTERVPLQRVTADPHENIYMRRDDVVSLVRDPQTFFVYGATIGNGEIPFESDTLTLAQALAKARGLDDNRADARGVFVFRYEQPRVLDVLRPGSDPARFKGKIPVVYHFDLSNPNSVFMQKRFQIANHDAIYVSNAPAIELQKALAIFNGIVSPVQTSMTAANSTLTIK